jgi:hypothetical protein
MSNPIIDFRQPARIATRALFSAGVLLLVAFPVSIAVTRYRTRAVDSGATPALAAEFRGHYGVLVIFQARDCAGYRTFFDALSGLARQRKGQVLGVAVNSAGDGRELRRAIADFSPAFPVADRFEAQAARILASMGYRNTPLAVVIDPSGRPSLILPPQLNPYRQAQMIQIANSYLDVAQNGGTSE